jgi:hypothetical protein
MLPRKLKLESRVHRKKICKCTLQPVFTSEPLGFEAGESCRGVATGGKPTLVIACPTLFIFIFLSQPWSLQFTPPRPTLPPPPCPTQAIIPLLRGVALWQWSVYTKITIKYAAADVYKSFSTHWSSVYRSVCLKNSAHFWPYTLLLIQQVSFERANTGHKSQV